MSADPYLHSQSAQRINMHLPVLCVCGSEGGKISSAFYTCVQTAFIYVNIIMNEYFINVGVCSCET